MSFRSLCQHISTFCDTFFHVLIQWKLQKTGPLRKLIPSENWSLQENWSTLYTQCRLFYFISSQIPEINWCVYYLTQGRLKKGPISSVPFIVVLWKFHCIKWNSIFQKNLNLKLYILCNYYTKVPNIELYIFCLTVTLRKEL